MYVYDIYTCTRSRMYVLTRKNTVSCLDRLEWCITAIYDRKATKIIPKSCVNFLINFFRFFWASVRNGDTLVLIFPYALTLTFSPLDMCEIFKNRPTHLC